MATEIVIVSGKGGTGKTSVAASLAVLAKTAVVADSDVDAADLHLVLRPEVIRTVTFTSGQLPVLDASSCVGCRKCVAHCRFGAISLPDAGQPSPGLDDALCEGCGVCAMICPVGAISMRERTCGEWYVSRTRLGFMVHARLFAAAENSGKLVTAVRREARRLAGETGARTVIVDGPPGIACPAIASITGASLALVVTEPTVSGAHDLERVLMLTRHFGVPAAVCVNKWDLNPAMTAAILARSRELGAATAGRVRYDTSVTRAQMEEKAVVEIDAPSGEDIRAIWDSVRQLGASHDIAI